MNRQVLGSLDRIITALADQPHDDADEQVSDAI
jgi:hypothetical protein